MFHLCSRPFGCYKFLQLGAGFHCNWYYRLIFRLQLYLQHSRLVVILCMICTLIVCIFVDFVHTWTLWDYRYNIWRKIYNKGVKCDDKAKQEVCMTTYSLLIMSVVSIDSCSENCLHNYRMSSRNYLAFPCHYNLNQLNFTMNNYNGELSLHVFWLEDILLLVSDLRDGFIKIVSRWLTLKGIFSIGKQCNKNITFTIRCKKGYSIFYNPLLD